MQENIPEWKRTSMILKEKQKKEGIREKIKGKVKSKFDNTQFAKDIYKSDTYKDYEGVKKEMGQFKEDLKDYIDNSQNKVLQTSMSLYVNIIK